MAISPLTPATPHAALPVLAPATSPEPAVLVTPAAGAADQDGTGSATSEQASRQAGQLPVEKALEEINRNMQAWSTSLRFEVDPDVKRVVVSIVDKETGEVLRTIPNEVVLRVAKMLVNLQGQAVATSA